MGKCKRTLVASSLLHCCCVVGRCVYKAAVCPQYYTTSESMSCVKAKHPQTNTAVLKEDTTIEWKRRKQGITRRKMMIQFVRGWCRSTREERKCMRVKCEWNGRKRNSSCWMMIWVFSERELGFFQHFLFSWHGSIRVISQSSHDRGTSFKQ